MSAFIFHCMHAWWGISAPEGFSILRIWNRSKSCKATKEIDWCVYLWVNSLCLCLNKYKIALWWAISLFSHHMLNRFSGSTGVGRGIALGNTLLWFWNDFKGLLLKNISEDNRLSLSWLVFTIKKKVESLFLSSYIHITHVYLYISMPLLLQTYMRHKGLCILTRAS